jgi:hypothetical protein
MGPVAIFDKSALQALGLDEAVWFDAFFLANLVPVFYVETLADLKKNVHNESTPEAVVGRLAEKTPSSAAPNVHHYDLILGELAGAKLTMDGRPVIRSGDFKRALDGGIGVHVEEFAEAAALQRWINHDFLAIERMAAGRWRTQLARFDPARRIGALKHVLPANEKISNLEQLKQFIDAFCSSDAQEVVALALDVLGVPNEYARFGLKRWEAAGRPPLDSFAQYTTHVFKVDLLYYLGILRGFISGERRSNKVDMAYLYYLPFAMVFVSGDRLHRRTVPLFLRDDQSYLPADEFKIALRELDDHYDALPEKIKQRGVLQFASYPPSDVDNAITRIWDTNMRPDWRDIARKREAGLDEPRDDDADRETVAELTRRVREAQPVTDQEASAHVDRPEYLVISRRVPARKGKWQIVPEVDAPSARSPSSTRSSPAGDRL